MYIKIDIIDYKGGTFKNFGGCLESANSRKFKQAISINTRQLVNQRKSESFIDIWAEQNAGVISQYYIVELSNHYNRTV